MVASLRFGRELASKQRLLSIVRWSSTFFLGASSAFALTMNTVANESFHAARLSLVLLSLIAVHLMLYQRIPLSREAKLYSLFVLYMLVQLLWTDDLGPAFNTLIPAMSFLLIIVLFDALMTTHNRRTVLTGMLCGVLMGALIYTSISGFPFTYPRGYFSYNAVAAMYLFGLFVALMLSCYSSTKWLIRVLVVVFLAHIVATTSIKTNLGLVLGLSAAGVLYNRYFLLLLRRNLLPVALLIAAVGYLAISNELLLGSIDRGITRIGLGIEVLQARDDLPGYTGFDKRNAWRQEGLAGWAQNPVFGHGVESFRSRYGATSHATPVDLLYNSGLVGFTLFYCMLASVALRLFSSFVRESNEVRFLVLSFLVCFSSISLSATMHYSIYLAAFLAISIGVTRSRTETAVLNPPKVVYQ